VREYEFKVKLTAHVRVGAANETVARAVATSALLAVSAGDIRMPDESEFAPVCEVSFTIEDRPMLDAIDGKRI
jgi:hypothetical protein